MKNLPYSGLFHPSAEKRFSETVVFVHHFGGDEKTLVRHVRFVNELGFDAVTFPLGHAQKIALIPPISSDMKIGMVPVWTEQIENMLNHIYGRKIVYSFSSPSAAAIIALARRNTIDVSAMICDGGPFLGYYRSLWQLFSREYEIKNPLLRLLAAGASKLIFSYDFEEQTRIALKKMPARFPILSIQGWRDRLVPPESIQAFFSRRQDLNLEVLSIPEGEHLNGLRDFPETYRPRVGNFLRTHAEALKASPQPSGLQTSEP